MLLGKLSDCTGTMTENEKVLRIDRRRGTFRGQWGGCDFIDDKATGIEPRLPQRGLMCPLCHAHMHAPIPSNRFGCSGNPEHSEAATVWAPEPLKAAAMARPTPNNKAPSDVSNPRKQLHHLTHRGRGAAAKHMQAHGVCIATVCTAPPFWSWVGVL